MSQVVRLPEDTWRSVRLLAGVLGRRPVDVLAEAWWQYVAQLPIQTRAERPASEEQ